MILYFDPTGGLDVSHADLAHAVGIVSGQMGKKAVEAADMRRLLDKAVCNT
jgi:hypothetical protein